jgi:hypothetical protein
MIGGPKSGKWPQPPWKIRQPIQIDQPEKASGIDFMPGRSTSHMPHPDRIKRW